YRKYVTGIEAEQQRTPPAYRVEPLDFQTWRGFMPHEENDPVLRGVDASYRSTLTRVSKIEHEAEQAANEEARQAVAAGQRDHGWKIPASVAGLNMSIEQAKKYASKQSAIFVSENRDYYPTRKNFETITGYLIAQGIGIADAATFKAAWE